MSPRKVENIADELSWLLLYLGIALITAVSIPYPASFFSAVALMLVLEYLRSRSLFMKITGLGELFKLLSNSQSRKKLVHYYCLSCGREHNELACPECGSKIKKIS